MIHDPENQYALVLSGDSLVQIMNEQFLTKQIIMLSEMSESVLACRVSPKQKMEIVMMVRSSQP